MQSVKPKILIRTLQSPYARFRLELTGIAQTHILWNGSEAMTTAGRRPKAQGADDGATTGYEAELWRMTDALRGSMDAAEYKHVVLYVGAAPQEDNCEPFEEKKDRLSAQWREQQAEAKRRTHTIKENLKRLGFLED